MKNLQYKNLWVITTPQGFPDWTTLSQNRTTAIQKFIDGCNLTHGRREKKYQWVSLKSKGYYCEKVDVSIYAADGRPCLDDAAKKVGLCGK